jgi:hypothetical protein
MNIVIAVILILVKLSLDSFKLNSKRPRVTSSPPDVVGNSIEIWFFKCITQKSYVFLIFLQFARRL